MIDFSKMEGHTPGPWVHQDGELYFASTYADGGTVIWLLECAKQQLLEVGD